jgi:hypothetical protein
VACLPRLIVIAKSCTGKNVNKRRAAAALLAENYSPGPTYLKQVLRDWLDDFHAPIEASLKRDRPYLKRPELSLDEQRKSFHRSERRRYGAVDPTVRATAELLKLILLGLAEAPGGDALAEVVAAFTAERVRASLSAASTEEIAQAYANVEEMMPAVTHSTHATYAYLTDHEDAFAALARTPHDREFVAGLVPTLREIVTADPEALARDLRLPYTLAWLHMRKQGLDEGFYQTLLAAITQLSALLHLDLEAGLQAGFRAGDAYAPPRPPDGSTDPDRPTTQANRAKAPEDASRRGD